MGGLPSGPKMPTINWPGIQEPGLPNMIFGLLTAQFAGIKYVLDFLPPSPTKLPELPSISIFIEAALGAVKLPSAYPAIKFGPITIPGKGIGPYKYDVQGQLKMLILFIMLPFMLILEIVKKLLQLQLVIPTVSMVLEIILGLAAQIGIDTPAFAKLSGCIAKMVVDLFKMFLPG
jgi:hypothetical protein